MFTRIFVSLAEKLSICALTFALSWLIRKINQKRRSIFKNSLKWSIFRDFSEFFEVFDNFCDFFKALFEFFLVFQKHLRN